MLLRVPSYYEEFRCLAGKCRHSCCIGWEIDIDEDTERYYRSCEGAFGDRLRAHMTAEDGCTSFGLDGEGRCPFLNRENLCDICIELGEEALSEVCTEYPRFTIEYGGVREKSMAVSCEEAARLLLEEEDPFFYTEFGVAEPLREDEDPNWYTAVEVARDTALRLCGRREFSLMRRMELLLALGDAVQEKIRADRPTEIPAAALNLEDHPERVPAVDIEELLGDTRERCAAYEELEVLDEEWETLFFRVRECFLAPDGEQRRREWSEKLRAYRPDKEYEYEQLLAYFIFRYTMQTVYDYSFFGHIAYAVQSLLMVRDMDAVRFADNGERFTFEDRIDIVRIYSREVEHSEENLELLQEYFAFR